MADFSSSLAWPPYPMTDGEWPQYGPQNWAPPGASSFYWPGFQLGNSGGGSSGLGAGTIILVAVLVTGFSLMALLILRLWFCGCTQDDDARQRGRIHHSSGSGAPSDASPTIHKYTFGLKREVIESFQMMDYPGLVASRPAAEGDAAESLGCPVCLIDFEAEDKKIRVLPGCQHSFHSDCVDMWLFSHTSCPVCRRDLQPKNTPGQGNPIDQVVIEIDRQG